MKNGKKTLREGGVSMCVFMLQQYEPQLCDLLTLSKTLSVQEDDQLKEMTHSCFQSVCVCTCAHYLCINVRDQISFMYLNEKQIHDA